MFISLDDYYSGIGMEMEEETNWCRKYLMRGQKQRRKQIQQINTATINNETFMVNILEKCTVHSNVQLED